MPPKLLRSYCVVVPAVAKDTLQQGAALAVLLADRRCEASSGCDVLSFVRPCV